MKNALLTTKKDKEFLQQLLELKEKNKTTWTTLLRNRYQQLLTWLLDKTPLLDNSYTLATRLYWVKEGLTDFPLCKYCNKEDKSCPLEKDVYQKRNIDNFQQGYFRACTIKCPNLNAERAKKTADTCIERYGSNCFLASADGKKKRDEWLKAHGVINAFQIDNIKKKAEETRLERYGVKYTMQSEEKRKLAANRYEAKTGYKHQFCNPETKAKTAATLADKKENGVDLYASRRLGNRIRRYNEFLQNTKLTPKFTYEEFCSLDANAQYCTVLPWHCKVCGSDFSACIDANFSSRMHLPARCPHCYPMLNDGMSNSEKELFNFLKDALPNEDVQQHCRTLISPYEVDICIPSKKLAIEFDGLFWHSTAANNERSKYYHLMKTQLCEAAGYKLVHVFENEWLLQKDIVKSRLLAQLGIYSQAIYARKCKVAEVNVSKAKEFLNCCHIQGAVNAKVNLGLFYNDELVSLMTFGKCRFDKKHEWEMLRFCCKLGHHVIGGAGKLLKHFERQYAPKSIVSYADRRWSQGKLYEALGFKLDHASAPNYWYFKNCSMQLESRVKYQKHKLKKILPLFDPAKSELQNMNANGYNTIYDCGNLVYVKEFV